MDRFQILKGLPPPPPLTAKEHLDAETLRIFQDVVDKKDVHKLLMEIIFPQRDPINRDNTHG